MAFKLPAINLSFLQRKQAAPDGAAPRDATAGGAPVPFLSGLSVNRQLTVLIGLLGALLLLDAIVVTLDNRQGTYGTIYIATAGKIRMLSQRLAKAAQQASQGNRAAFAQLRESRDEFAALVKLLAEGGNAG